jgi:acetoacetyl-CoA synthetase
MPVFFWNDPNFKKYHSSYFEKNKGVWTHGDWIYIDPKKGIVMQGRSDATLNRNGIRIGTSEIYNVLDQFDEIKDSLIIDLTIQNSSKLILFLTTIDPINNELKKKIKNVIKLKCSPRHIPNFIFSVSEIPYTISGKKMEIPIKKIMSGKEIRETISKGAMKNPGCLNEYIDIKNQYLESLDR